MPKPDDGRGNLYEQVLASDDPSEQRDLLRQIEVFWREYKDIQARLAQLGPASTEPVEDGGEVEEGPDEPTNDPVETATEAGEDGSSEDGDSKEGASEDGGV